MYTVKPSALSFLVPLYNSPDRHYHNLDHIHFCLHKMDEYISEHTKMSLDDIDILIYSIWFHDSIYSPYKNNNSSNEKDSADLFHDWFVKENDNRFSNRFYAEVRQNILLTEFHLFNIKLETETSKIMLDIDLAGFARPFELVLATSDQIFKEYQCLGLDKKIMLENRIKFLQAMLSKSRIFYTDYFYDKYEAIARENINEVIIRSNFELTLL